jgi:hypothetical protein
MRKLAKDGAKRMHLEETTVFTARLVSAPTCSRGSRMAALKQEIILQWRLAKSSAAIYCGSFARFCQNQSLIPDD